MCVCVWGAGGGGLDTNSKPRYPAYSSMKNSENRGMQLGLDTVHYRPSWDWGGVQVEEWTLCRPPWNWRATYCRGWVGSNEQNRAGSNPKPHLNRARVQCGLLVTRRPGKSQMEIIPFVGHRGTFHMPCQLNNEFIGLYLWAGEKHRRLRTTPVNV